MAIVSLGLALVIGTRGHRHLGRLGDGRRRGHDGGVPVATAPSRPSSPRSSPGRSLGVDQRHASWRSWASSPSWPRWACSWPAAASPSSSPSGRLTEIFDPILGSLGSGASRSPGRAVERSPVRGGRPFVLIITLAIAVVIAFVVGRTTFGRHVLATGGNPTASATLGRARQAHADRRLRPVRAPGRHRRHHRHGAHGRRGPVVPGQPHRAAARSRRWSSAARRSPVARCASLGTLAGALLLQLIDGDAHPQQPVRLDVADGRGAHHPRRPSSSSASGNA